MGDSMLQTPSTEIPMIKMQGGGNSPDVYTQPANEIPLVQMKGGGQEDVVAVLAGILASRPEDKDIKESLDSTLATVIGSISTGKPLANALTGTAVASGQESGTGQGSGSATGTTSESATQQTNAYTSDVIGEYYTKLLSPNEQKLRVRVFPEDKDPESKDSPNNKMILAFLNPKPDTFQFDELKVFQNLLFTQPDILTYLRSLNPHEFIKFWRTYVEHDGTSVITLHTTQAGKQIKSFLNKLHNSRLTYSLYKAKELLRPYEVKKMEEEYGDIKAPSTIADSAKKFSEMFVPEKRALEASESGSPPPSIQQDYKEPQQKENIEKLNKSLEKLKEARKEPAIVGDTITKADTQLGPYSIFKTTYEGLEVCVKEITGVKNNLDDKVAELNTYAEKKSKEERTPIEQIALRAVIDTHNKIKGEYEKYISELAVKIKEAGELLTAEKETYDKVSKALNTLKKAAETGEKEVVVAPIKPTTTPVAPLTMNAKAPSAMPEVPSVIADAPSDMPVAPLAIPDAPSAMPDAPSATEAKEEEEEKPPAVARVESAKEALEKELNTHEGKIIYIKNQLSSMNLDSETLNQDIIDKILIKLFSGKKWNAGEDYCKSFYDKKTCDTSFYSFIKKSPNKQTPITLKDLKSKINNRRVGISLNTIIKSLLYLPSYTEEQQTVIRNLLNAFEMQERLWDKYPNDQPQGGGRRRRRTRDHKKPGKRVTRRH
jgi:hypothetical protein